MKFIIDWFNKPFPNEDLSLSQLWRLGLIGVFVTLFLYYVQPFGMEAADENRGLVAIAFGAITFGISILYQYISQLLGYGEKLENKLTLGIWTLHTLGLLLAIAIANFLFIHFVYHQPINISTFLFMLKSTLIVGVFPVVFIGAITVQKGEEKYRLIAEKMALHKKESKSGKVIFNIPAKSILYIEALQNYVKIIYQDDEKNNSKTERSTLTALEIELENTHLKRCHRSYIVNVDKVVDVSGNAQGLKLSLDQLEKVIPVSRKYVSDIKNIIS